jgi:hypothetical protein
MPLFPAIRQNPSAKNYPARKRATLVQRFKLYSLLPLSSLNATNYPVHRTLAGGFRKIARTKS